MLKTAVKYRRSQLLNREEQMKINLTKYRWVILAISCLINLCIGSIYAWSVLASPMAEELRVDDLSIVFSVANAVGFITMIIGGILNDRYGPRWIVFTGGLMFGSGMLISGYANSVFALTAGYGLLLGLGLALVYGCTISNTIKFFPDRRGMVGGLTTAAYGISSVLIAPVASALNSMVGVRASFKILGLVFVLVICTGSFFLKKCPNGFSPEGFQPSQGETEAGAQEGAGGDYTPLEMLRTPVFYIMLLFLTCGGVFGMMIISSAYSIGVNMAGLSSSAASLMVSVLCIFNTTGRLAAGTLSDKFGRVNTLTAAIVIAVAGLIVLYLADLQSSFQLFAAGVILVGICFGTFMGVFPGFTADRFGVKHNTVNYGIMWIGFSLAGIIGPSILTKAVAATGNYRMAFLIALFIAVLGLLTSFAYRGLNRRKPQN